MTTTAEEPEVTAYCAQVAEVEVDPDTGQVTVHRIVTAHDVGTIINPLDHQGQIDSRGDPGTGVCPDGRAARGRGAHLHAQSG